VSEAGQNLFVEALEPHGPLKKTLEMLVKVWRELKFLLIESLKWRINKKWGYGLVDLMLVGEIRLFNKAKTLVKKLVFQKDFREVKNLSQEKKVILKLFE